MTTQTTIDLGPVTYWIRLGDLVPDARICAQLIEHTRRGMLQQSDDEIVDWIQEAETLLRLLETQVGQVGGPDYPDLVDIVRSTPEVDSLRSVLASMLQ